MASLVISVLLVLPPTSPITPTHSTPSLYETRASRGIVDLQPDAETRQDSPPGESGARVLLKLQQLSR